MRPAGPGPQAVTLDAWFTLLYQTARMRREYEDARRTAWVGPMAATGVPRSEARRWYDAMVDEARRQEASGVAWDQSRQARWLTRRVRRPVRLEEIREHMDRAVDRAEARIAPGAVRSLRGIRARGIPLALVSNVLYESSESVRRLLARLGVLELVDTVVLSTEVERSKPDPRPVREALRRLKVAPKLALHIGDTAGDVEAAWRAGASAARFVGLRRYWPAHHGRFLPPALSAAPVLDRWDELPGRLARFWNEGRPPVRGQASA